MNNLQTIARKRLQKIQEQVADLEIDWLYLAAGPNLTYATAHVAAAPSARLDKVRLTAALIPAEGESAIVCPPLLANEVKENAWIERLELPSAGETHFEIVKRIITDGHHGALRVGIDEKIMWGIMTRLRQSLPQGTEFTDVTTLFHELRLIKDSMEINLLRKASKIADAALAQAISTIEPGRTEIDIANEIVNSVRSEGGICTLSQVVSGAGRYPENPSFKRIEKGDVITMDVNAVYGGYYSDETRVAVVGPPDDEQTKVHEIVLRANEAARAKVKPGVTGGSVHKAGASIIDDSGYGDYYTHGIGHGLGVEGHEAPYLKNGSPDVLEAGMVHTIEPAIYGRNIGKFSIRLEDVVLVTDTGCELLTTQTHELVQI